MMNTPGPDKDRGRFFQHFIFLRHSPGGIPVTRLNAAENVLALE